MSKPIKVSDEVYNELDRLRIGRQTFSDVIYEILKGRRITLEAMNVLEGSFKFREWQLEQRDLVGRARADRADLESRRLDK